MYGVVIQISGRGCVACVFIAKVVVIGDMVAYLGRSSLIAQRLGSPTNAAQRLQYHRFRPYWIMFHSPVLTSMLGVL
jgi:hypothetical protein